MKDYYSLFIDLSKQQCTASDYINKKRIKEHNEAAKQIKKLQFEIDSKEALNVLDILLEYDDERVKINAASICLEKGIFVEKASCVLKRIESCSEDHSLAFSAKMLLKMHETK